MLKRMLSVLFSLAVAASLISIYPGVTRAAANDTLFGPNVYVFDPSMSANDIQNTANAVFAAQETNQFGSQRYALLFKPGSYNVNVKVGFYTQVAGLGQNPGDVHINGGVNADAQWAGANATTNFWRSIENFTVNPSASSAHVPSGTAQWAVSQAAPMRRVHVQGNLYLFDFDGGWNAGWASGGFISDSLIDGKVTPASQQQFFTRNTQYNEWSNGVWNMVFVGDANPPAAAFPDPPYTIVDQTPVMREKPYLYVNGSGQYNVFVPSLQTNTRGISWAGGNTPGQSIPIDQFYIAQPGASTAASINAALDQGKNVLFTPGIYHLSDTIRVDRPNTVILGLGYASLVPDNGQTALSVADVDGVKVAGLLFEAGAANSSALMEVGPAGSSLNHSANPTSLHDLFFGIGGMAAGSADVGLKINSDNVIGDHFWIWRADHGAGAGWNSNVSKNGLVVNGNDVTVYGLFNEHHEEYQTLWNGNGGRTYFYQSEIPYDVPGQSAWMSQNGAVKGYASYKVADSVTSHEAWGLGVYSYFRDADVDLDSAIEVPDVQGVKIHHMTTIWLSGTPGSEITHVINDIGGRVYANSPGEAMRQTVAEFQGSGVGGGDTEAPSAPSNLTASAVSGSQIDLHWTASTDNVGVIGYDIYRNGSLAGFSDVTSYSDTGLAASTPYSYTVKARDAANHASAASNTAGATTLSGGGGGDDGDGDGGSGTETALDRTGWTATSTPTSGDAPANLLDGSMSTRWSTGAAMTPGQSITVDMKSSRSFNRVVMDSTGSNDDYARGYEVYVSDDGTSWGSAVASGAGSGPVVTADFGTRQARYVKIVQTGTASSWWSIRELNVYTDGDTGGGDGGDDGDGDGGSGTETALDRTGWTATSTPTSGDAPANLLDGSMSTRWSTGAAMTPGQSITVDMKSSRSFNRVVMDSTGSNDDYARGYEVYVSDDGTNWGSAVASGAGSGPVVTADFGTRQARYVKVVQTGTASNWWSIRELNVYY